MHQTANLDATYHPSEEDIENSTIEEQVERFEADLRGENGEEAQKLAAAIARANHLKEADDIAYHEEHELLRGHLGSPALAKACIDYFDYALKLDTGEVIRFTSAKWHGNGWLTIYATDGDQPASTCSTLPYPADRGVDIRLENILWVMDAPQGS